MRVLVGMLALSMLLAGCAGDPAPLAATDDVTDSDGDGVIDALETALGTDPFNATDVPDVMVHEDIGFDETVRVVGTGVPSVQCPADAVNSQVITWTIEAPERATDVHVVDMAVTIAGAATVNDADVFIYAPSGDLIGSATSGTASETATAGKQYGVGEYQIEVRGCSGAGDVTATATAVLGYTPDVETLLHQNGVEHEH